MGSNCGTCANVPGGGPPGILKQSDLVSVNINEIRESVSGCGVGNTCIDNGFKFPLNQEYTSTDGKTECMRCLDGPGCDCTCDKVSILKGTRCALRRVAFNGSDDACCLKGGGGHTTGMKQNAGYLNWDDYNKDTYTCDTTMQPYELGGKFDCPNKVADICTSASTTDLFKLWAPNGYCRNWVLNAAGDIQAVAPVLGKALDTFIGTYGIDIQGGPTYEAHRQHLANLLSICSSYGSVCSPRLQAGCAIHSPANPKPMTRGDVTTAYANSVGNLNAQNIVSSCGCHLPEIEYREYIRDGFDIGNTNACDPLCKLPGTIPHYNCVDTYGNVSPNPENNNPVPCIYKEAVCSQNICVIDDVTINIVNSNVGDIGFNIACGGCDNAGGCMCIFDDINVLTEASNVGNINFNSSCGGNCYINDDAGIPSKKVPCPGASNNPNPNSWTEWFYRHYVEIGIAIVILIAVIVVVYMVFNRNQYVTSPSISTKITDNGGVTTPDISGYYGGGNYYG